MRIETRLGNDVYQSKRVLDILLSILILLMLLPLILICVLTLLIMSGQNPFFIQKRIGLNETTFSILKLRTLFSEETPILKSFGLLLRQYSIDELPQLINVIRGEMSLIGPRPLLPEYLPYYSEEERQRHSVRPGVTGLAQVNGRNSLSWKKKFAYDTWYARNVSLFLDFQIVLATVYQVLMHRNVKPEGLGDHEKFRGHGNQMTYIRNTRKHRLLR